MTAFAGCKEIRYPGGRVPEEAERPFVAPRRAGQLGSTARAVRDGSIGRCLLTNTVSNWALTKFVTTRIAQKGVTLDKRHFPRIALQPFGRPLLETTDPGLVPTYLTRYVVECHAENLANLPMHHVRALL